MNQQHSSPRRAMLIGLAACTSAALAQPQPAAPAPGARPAAQQRASTVLPATDGGISHRRLSFPGADGKAVAVDVFTVDPAIAAIEVVALRPPGRSKVAGAGVGVTEMARQYAKPGRQPAALVLSGGNILSVPDIPMGGLVVNGSEVAPFDRRPSPALRQTDADKARANECRIKTEAVGRRLGGVLCVNGPKVAVRLSRDIEAAPAAACRHAIQSLPVVVHPADGSNGICSSEALPSSTAAPAERSVACVTADGRVHFAITGPTLLYPLAEWLRSPSGLGCRAALNLVGDYFAAAHFLPGGKAEPVVVGNGYAAQASMIVVRGR